MNNNKYIPELKKKYIYDIIPSMVSNFSYTSIMKVPKLVKVVINQCIGDIIKNKKILNSSLNEISQICGQKAVICYSKKNISSFNLRKGMPIGCKVTLRNDIMYEFIYKLIHIVLPRKRDFNGLSIKSFDNSGNYNIGIDEQIIFPEIDIDNIIKIYGLNISIVLSSTNVNESFYLLSKMGFPFIHK